MNKKCISILEELTKLGKEMNCRFPKLVTTYLFTFPVTAAEMFSSNENFEEIATEHLKFLLLPFFLAQTTLKLSSAHDRTNILDVAKIYYQDYLNRCEEYGLGERTITAVSKSVEIGIRDEVQRLTQMAQQRNHKIQKYQQKKELKEQIAKLKIDLEKETVDDEIKRKFYTKLIKLCIWDAQDELIMLDQEIEILGHMDALRKHEGGDDERKHAQTTSRQTVPPLKPIIITRDNVQKAVYGLGYPSIPTFTVKEFYDQRVADGVFPSEQQLKDNSLQSRAMIQADEAEEEEKRAELEEIRVENDDPELLQRARDMDEFKDDHRRGSGNRYNRS